MPVEKILIYSIQLPLYLYTKSNLLSYPKFKFEMYFVNGIKILFFYSYI